MKKNRITLTDEMLKLVSTIKIYDTDLPSGTPGGRIIAGIESNSVYGGSDLLEDVSMAIGLYDEHINGTEEDPEGISFNKDIADKMYDMHDFVIKNLIVIEHLIHYWSNKGGLTEGTYDTITMQKIA